MAGRTPRRGSRLELVEEGSVPEIAGWIIKYSVVGKSDWKPKTWRWRFLTATRKTICYYKKEVTKQLDSQPCGILDLELRREELTVYFSIQNDFAFSADGFNYFVGVRYFEEDDDGSVRPLLLLLKCPDKQHHERWTTFLTTFMRSEPFNQIKKDFPTFSVAALEKSVKDQGDPPSSGVNNDTDSEEDDMRDKVEAFMSSASIAPVDSGDRLGAAGKANLDAARKRLQGRHRGRDRQGGDDSAQDIKSKLAALRDRNKGHEGETAASRFLHDVQQQQQAEPTQRRMSFTEEVEEEAPTSSSSRVQGVLARTKARKEGKDLASKLAGLTTRLNTEVENDSVGDVDTVVSGDESVSKVSATSTQMSARRAQLLAKAKEKRAQRMSDADTQTEEEGIVDDRLQDALARAQAAEADQEEKTRQLSDVRARCQSLAEERDRARDRAAKAEQSVSEKVSEALSKQAAEFKEHIVRLEEERDEQRAQLTEANTAKTTLEKTLDDIKKKLSEEMVAERIELDRRVEEATAASKEAERRAEDMERELAEATSKLKALEGQLTTLQSELQAAEAAARDSREKEAATREEIQQQVASQREDFEKQLAAKDDEIALVKGSLEEKERELHAKADEVSQQAVALQEAQEKVTDLQREEQKRREAAEAGQSETVRLQAEVDRASQRIKELEKARDETQKENERLKDEVSESRVKEQAASEELGGLQGVVEDLKAEVGRLSASAEEKEEKIRELEEQLAAATEEKERVEEDRRRAAEQHKEKVGQLEADIAKQEEAEMRWETVQGLLREDGEQAALAERLPKEGRCSLADVVHGAARAWVEDRDSRKLEVEEVRREADRLKGEVEERGQLSDEYERIVGEKREVQDALDAARAEVKALRGEGDTRETELAKLRAEVAELRDRLALHTEDADAAGEVARRLLQEKRELERELEEVREELTALRERLDTCIDEETGREAARMLLQQKKQTERELQEAKEAMAALEEEVAALKGAAEEAAKVKHDGGEAGEWGVEEAHSQGKEEEEGLATEDVGKEVARRLLREKKELESLLAEARSEVAALTAQVESLKAGQADLAAEVGALRSDKEILEEEVARGREDVKRAEELQSERDTLLKEVGDARAQAEELTKNIEELQQHAPAAEVAQLREEKEALEKMVKEIAERGKEERSEEKGEGGVGDGRVAELEEEVKNGRQRIAELEEEVKKRKQRIAELEEKEGEPKEDMKNGRQRIAELEEEVKKGKQRIAELEEEVRRSAKSVRSERSLSQGSNPAAELEALKNSSLLAAESVLQSESLPPQLARELLEALEELKKTNDELREQSYADDRARREVYDKVAALQEKLEASQPLADETGKAAIADAQLKMKYYDGLTGKLIPGTSVLINEKDEGEATPEGEGGEGEGGDDEETWKEVARRLLHEKREAEARRVEALAEVDEAKGKLQMLSAEIAELRRDAPREARRSVKEEEEPQMTAETPPQLAEKEARIRELEMGLATQHDSISELEDALLRERLRGDEVTEELRQQLADMTARYNDLLAKLSALDSKSPSPERADDDGYHAPAQTGPSPHSPTSPPEFPDDTDDIAGWKEVARKLLKEKQALADQLDAARADLLKGAAGQEGGGKVEQAEGGKTATTEEGTTAKGATESEAKGTTGEVVKSTGEVVKGAGVDEGRDPEEVQAFLRAVADDPQRTAHLAPAARERLAELATCPLSTDPVALEGQAAELRSLLSEVHHGEDDNVVWKEVARRVLREKKILEKDVATAREEAAALRRLLDALQPHLDGVECPADLTTPEAILRAAEAVLATEVRQSPHAELAELREKLESAAQELAESHVQGAQTAVELRDSRSQLNAALEGGAAARRASVKAEEEAEHTSARLEATAVALSIADDRAKAAEEQVEVLTRRISDLQEAGQAVVSPESYVHQVADAARALLDDVADGPLRSRLQSLAMMDQRGLCCALAEHSDFLASLPPNLRDAITAGNATDEVLREVTTHHPEAVATLPTRLQRSLSRSGRAGADVQDEASARLAAVLAATPPEHIPPHLRERLESLVQRGCQGAVEVEAALREAGKAVSHPVSQQAFERERKEWEEVVAKLRAEKEDLARRLDGLCAGEAEVAELQGQVNELKTVLAVLRGSSSLPTALQHKLDEQLAADHSGDLHRHVLELRELLLEVHRCPAVPEGLRSRVASVCESVVSNDPVQLYHQAVQLQEVVAALLGSEDAKAALSPDIVERLNAVLLCSNDPATLQQQVDELVHTLAAVQESAAAPSLSSPLQQMLRDARSLKRQPRVGPAPAVVLLQRIRELEEQLREAKKDTDKADNVDTGDMADKTNKGDEGDEGDEAQEPQELVLSPQPTSPRGQLVELQGALAMVLESGVELPHELQRRLHEATGGDAVSRRLSSFTRLVRDVCDSDAFGSLPTDVADRLASANLASLQHTLREVAAAGVDIPEPLPPTAGVGLHGQVHTLRGTLEAIRKLPDLPPSVVALLAEEGTPPLQQLLEGHLSTDPAKADEQIAAIEGILRDGTSVFAVASPPRPDELHRAGQELHHAGQELHHAGQQHLSPEDALRRVKEIETSADPFPKALAALLPRDVAAAVTPSLATLAMLGAPSPVAARSALRSEDDDDAQSTHTITGLLAEKHALESQLAKMSAAYPEVPPRDRSYTHKNCWQRVGELEEAIRQLLGAIGELETELDKERQRGDAEDLQAIFLEVVDTCDLPESLIQRVEHLSTLELAKDPEGLSQQLAEMRSVARELEGSSLPPSVAQRLKRALAVKETDQLNGHVAQLRQSLVAMLGEGIPSAPLPAAPHHTQSPPGRATGGDSESRRSSDDSEDERRMKLLEEKQELVRAVQAVLACDAAGHLPDHLVAWLHRLAGTTSPPTAGDISELHSALSAVLSSGGAEHLPQEVRKVVNAVLAERFGRMTSNASMTDSIADIETMLLDKERTIAALQQELALARMDIRYASPVKRSAPEQVDAVLDDMHSLCRALAMQETINQVMRSVELPADVESKLRRLLLVDPLSLSKEQLTTLLADLQEAQDQIFQSPIADHLPRELRENLVEPPESELSRMQGDVLQSALAAVRATGIAVPLVPDGASVSDMKAALVAARRDILREREKARRHELSSAGEYPSTDSDMDFVEALGLQAKSHGEALRNVLESPDAHIPDPLRRRLESLVATTRSPPQIRDSVQRQRRESEVVALHSRVAELDARAIRLQEQAQRADKLAEAIRAVQRHPGLPADARKALASALAGDAAVAAATSVEATRPTTQPQVDLEEQVAELLDALRAVRDCPASEQLPDEIRERLDVLTSSTAKRQPVLKRMSELQEVMAAVRSSPASDMLPEWLAIRLERLTEAAEQQRRTPEILQHHVERLEHQVRRLDGAASRIDHLAGAVRQVQAHDGVSDGARRALSRLLSEDAAAAQRLLAEVEAADAASVGPSPCEAGAAAVAALLRTLEERLRNSDGGAVQLAEATSAATGLSSSQGVVGSAMKVVSHELHAALSRVRVGDSLGAAEKATVAMKVAEDAAAAAAAARSAYAELQDGGKEGVMRAVSKLQKAAGMLGKPCAQAIDDLSRRLRAAAARQVTDDDVAQLAVCASEVAGFSFVPRRSAARFTAAPEVAHELRRAAADLRASGAPVASTVAVDEVARLLETGESTVAWNLPAVVSEIAKSEAGDSHEDEEWMKVDPAVARALRDALKVLRREDGAVLAEALDSSKGRTAPIIAAVLRLQMRDDLLEKESEALHRVLFACDDRAARLANAAVNVLRGDRESDDVVQCLTRGLRLSSSYLATMGQLAQSTVPAGGVPDHVVQELGVVMHLLDDTCELATQLALRDPHLPESVRRILQRGGDHPKEATLEMALAAGGPNLPQVVRRMLHEALSEMRKAVVPKTVLPTLHVSLPHLLRKGMAAPSSEAVVSGFTDALRSGRDRVAVLEASVNGALQIGSLSAESRRLLRAALHGEHSHPPLDFTPHTADRAPHPADKQGTLQPALAHLATPPTLPSPGTPSMVPPTPPASLSAPPVRPPADSTQFSPTDVRSLSGPGVKERLEAIVSTSEGIPPKVRAMLSDIASVGDKHSIPRGAEAQVVVVEPPGAGEWLDCTVEGQDPDGTYRIRVAVLSASHPAARFSGRILRVAGEHLRVKEEPLPPLPVGERVRRNVRFWKWGEQDGGEGRLGTVIEVEKLWLTVQWDTCRRGRYRWGKDGAYDVIPVAKERRPPLKLNTRVRRNVLHWKWGDQDGNGLGTVVGTDDGWATVSWDKTGRKGRYRWGHEHSYDLEEVKDDDLADEADMRAALRAVLAGPDGETIPPAAREHIEQLAAPSSPRGKVLDDLKTMLKDVRREPKPLPQNIEDASHRIATLETAIAEKEKRIKQLEDANAVLTDVDTLARQHRPADEPVWKRLEEATELLHAVSAGLTTAREQCWVLLPPEVADRVRKFVNMPPLEIQRTAPSTGPLQVPAPGLLDALREVLEARDHQLANQILTLAQHRDGLHLPSVASVQPSPTPLCSVGCSAVPETCDAAVSADLQPSTLIESLQRRLESERMKVKDLQVELVIATGGQCIPSRSRAGSRPASHRRSRSASSTRSLGMESSHTIAEPDLEPDPEVTRSLRKLTLMSTPPVKGDPEWVDKVVAEARADPTLGRHLPDNFGRDGSGRVRFGTTKVDLVSVNEFAAVRIGGGYMLFNEFVRRFADTERRKLIINRDQPADQSKPLALVRSGRDMVFVDPPPLDDTPARGSTPRRVRRLVEEPNPALDPEWHGTVGGVASPRPVPQKTGPLPEGYLDTPLGVDQRLTSPSPRRYASSPSPRMWDAVSARRQHGLTERSWTGKPAPEPHAVHQPWQEQSEPTPSDETPDESDEVVEEEVPEEEDDDVGPPDSFDLLEARMREILQADPRSSASPVRHGMWTPPSTPGRSPSRPKPVDLDSNRQSYRSVTPSDPARNLEKRLIRYTDQTGKRVFPLATHPTAPDAKVGLADWSSYMSAGESKRVARQNKPPLYPM